MNRQHLVALAVGLSLALGLAPPASGDDTDSLEQPWTFLIYGAADNNADGPILDFLRDVRQNWADDPGIEMFLFLDRSMGFSKDATALGEDFTGARLYELHSNTAERLDGGEEFPEITLDEEYEADSADPENLRKFIAWAKQHHPARRYGLMIYSHADGISMCPDEASETQMGIAELTDVLGEEDAIDFLALELCNMGGVEIAYQWRPGNGGFFADVLVAIPNAGPPLDWGRAFARIRSPGDEAVVPDHCFDPAKLDAQGFGRLIVEEGGLGRLAQAKEHPERAEDMKYESVAAYDLYAAEDVKQAVDALAVALVEHDGREAFEALRGPGTACCAMNYVGDNLGRRPYVDLFDLCDRAAHCKDLSEEIRTAAAEVLTATDAMILDSFGMDGLAGFTPGKNGVFVVFPDGAARDPGALLGGGRVWRRMTWYTPLALEDDSGEYGCWSWCADGATAGNGEVENWFEMLDAWYDESNARGGANGYLY